MTYFGGNNSEISSDIKLSNDKLYLTGTTYSNDFPAINPDPGNTSIYCENYNNGRDFFISIFDITRDLFYSSCIGGSDDEYCGSGNSGVNNLYVDNTNNIYVVGSTKSTDFPCEPFGGINSYNKPTLTGNSDGFIFKLNSNLHLIWSTYYGSDNNDEIFAVKGNSYGAFITGKTISGAGITNNFPGFYNDNTLGYSGYSDAFLSFFDNNNVQGWATYLGGIDRENGFDIKIKNNYLYLTGITCTNNTNTGSGYIFDVVDPGNNAYFQDLHGGGSWDSFISVFDISNIDIGVAELQSENNTINIFPNPVSTKLFVEIINYKLGVMNLKIFDINGKEVLTQTIESPKTEVNISNFAKGFYIIQVQTNSTILSSKIIKY